MTSETELERSAPVLSFGDRGFSECNLVDIFLRLDNGFNEESLGWLDIVDEVEVENDERCPLFTEWLSKHKSRFSILPTHTITETTDKHNPNEHPNAPRPALSHPGLCQLKFRVSQAKSSLPSHRRRRIVHVVQSQALALTKPEEPARWIYVKSPTMRSALFRKG